MDRSAGSARRTKLQTPAVAATIVLFCIIIGSAALPRTAEAATASIGGNFYYMAWQPAWGDGTTAFVPYYFAFMNTSSLTPGLLLAYRNSARMRINDYEPIHGPMAGPSLSVGFADRWSISSVFLAGRFIANSTGQVTEGVTDKLLPYMGAGNILVFLNSHYRRVITRYDSDTTIACGLNRYVRLFAGFKYQGYEYDESINYFSNFGGLLAHGAARFHSFGGGLGLGLTFPLAAGLYANINLSGLCMYGIASYDFGRQLVYGTTLTPILTQFKDERYWSVGGNSILALTYQFEKSGVALSLGFRYQALYYFWQANNPKGFLDYYGRLDHSYGGTFSIIYSFGGKKA